MEEIVDHFYQTNKEIEYDAIRKSMLYIQNFIPTSICLLYTSDAADE